MKRTLLLAIAAVLLVPAGARAEAGTVSGRVTDAEGNPASEACVYFFDAAVAPGLEGAVPNPVGTTGIAVTDADGRYRIELGFGTYRVLFSECDVFPGPMFGHRRYVREWHSDKATYEEADRVSTGAAELVLDAVLAIRTGIAGRVTGGDGAPLGGVCVNADIEDGTINTTTRTASDGTYRLLPDEFSLKIHFFSCDQWGSRTTVLEQKWWRHGRTFEAGDRIDFRQGTEITGIDTELDPA